MASLVLILAGTTREVGVTTLILPKGWSGRTWTDGAVDKTKKTNKVKKKDKAGSVVTSSINLIWYLLLFSVEDYRVSQKKDENKTRTAQ